MLTEAQIKFYEKEGYIVVKNIFNQKDMLMVQTALENITSSVLSKTSAQMKSKKDIESMSFDQKFIELASLGLTNTTIVQRAFARAPEFFHICSDPKISQIIRRLMSVPEDNPLYLISNGALFTPPSKEAKILHPSHFRLEWHNDMFFTIPRSEFVHMWAPLMHDSTEEIGTLQLLPRSHKKMIRQNADLDISYNHRYQMDLKELAQFTPISVPITLGDVLFFNGRLFHASGDNRSDKVRVTMVGLFHNVNDKHFLPVAPSYKYMNETPEQYFYSIFKDEKILSGLTTLLESEENIKKSSV